VIQTQEVSLGLLLILAVPLTILYIALPGRWIVRPVDRAAAARNAPARFSIADFFCLFWAIQLPLAFAIQLNRLETERFFWIALLLVWLVAPLVWVVCTRALSKAGVTRVRHRAIFLAGVLPVVYYGMLIFIGVPCLVLNSLVTGEPPRLISYQTMAVVSVLLAVGLAASGWYTPWMIATANEPVVESSKGI
jgi:hypothetical protein